MTRFFIERPIFSTVLSLIIVIAGLVSFLNLPIAQYPNISPPTVTVSATYTGASADTMSKVVIAPIEEQLSGIPGLMYYSSSATSTGSMSIVITFDVDVDIDMAMVDVNNRVKMVEPRLPEDVRRNGVSVRKRSDEMLMIVALSSPDASHDALSMSNYAKLNMVDELKRVPGIGDVRVFGSRDYAMRIWLDPIKMRSFEVSTSEVNQAIRAQNTQNAIGRIGENPVFNDQQLSFSVIAKGRLMEVEDFANIILRHDISKGIIRLSDVARIELGAQDYSTTTYLDGTPSVGMGINLQSGANALDVADGVRAELDRLKTSFPDGMEMSITLDNTLFIDESINAVVVTLVEAMILVTLVIFLFLQNWRATIIPLLAIPVSLIGAMAGLLLLDFSINTLTLFAMVLVIGIVVDDAIIVIENVERNMRVYGMEAKPASIKAMKEVSSALIAMVLVLCAVFIPVSFMGGMAGQLYKQFAVTVSVAMVISGIVALTLTPALCAIMLKPHKEPAKPFQLFNRWFERITDGYMAVVARVIKHRKVSVSLFIACIVGVYGLTLIIPTSFVPSEDQGTLIGSIQLPDNAALVRTDVVIDDFRQRIASIPGISSIYSIGGMDFIGAGATSNAGAMFIRLADWKDREASAAEVAAGINRVGMGLGEGIGMAFNPPAIRGLGSTGGFEFFLQNRADGDPRSLFNEMNTLIAALNADPMFQSARSFFRVNVPQLYVEVDEAKAMDMNLSIAAVYETLQSMIGSSYVNDFNRSGKTYRVLVQAEQEFRSSPEDILQSYVKNSSGNLIPLSAIAKVSFITGPEQLSRFNGFLSAKISGSAEDGVSSGEAIQRVEEIARETLSDGYVVAWSGQAYQEINSASTTSLAFALSIVMVFLILCALYEKWSLPLAVILSIPFAMLGAYGSLLVRGMSNDVYFQIGLVVLVGLCAKNAILIVEFAQQKLNEGMTPVNAAIEASRLRFRPIVMTSLAFILGIAPLVVSTGAGAAARQSMGTGVFGGMLASTFIASFFVPLFFILLTRKKKTVETA